MHKVFRNFKCFFGTRCERTRIGIAYYRCDKCGRRTRYGWDGPNTYWL